MISAFLAVFTTVSSVWAATPLGDFAGRSRVLVVVAPSPDSQELKTQDRWLQAGGRGLRDRDVIVIKVVGTKVAGPSATALSSVRLRDLVGPLNDGFGVALLGKDGSTALRRSSPIPMSSLFQTIDAMPMRREEMRQARP